MVKSKIKSSLVGVSAGIILAAAPAVVLAQSDNGNSNVGNKVTICHATGSQTNPYVQISPNANGVISGHVNHQDNRDIIPPFDYNDHGTTKHFAGQNFDTNGQAILNNGCVVPASQQGGQGGGQNQVLGSTTTGGQAAQVQTPQGAVSGGGGAAALAHNQTAAIGLVGSLLSLGSGLALLNRRQS